MAPAGYISVALSAAAEPFVLARRDVGEAINAVRGQEPVRTVASRRPFIYNIIGRNFIITVPKRH